MANYHIPLLPDNTYHIFSRAIGAEKLFLEPDNYRFFLKKYQQHVTPIAETFAYNLLPNHFHFLIRIKDIDDIDAHFALKKECRNLL